MLKSLVRNFAIFGTILAILSNIFIITYPSIHPLKCSWNNCSSDTNNLTGNATVNLNCWNKFIFYTKRYINDVKFQFSNDNVETHNINNTIPTDEIHLLAFGDPQIKGIWKSTPYRSRLDIFGNDFYLGHIFATMQKRLNPSHVVVLGDLFSSQWIGDSEFFNRTKRYMTRIFKRNNNTVSLNWLDNLQKENHKDEPNGLYKIDWQKWGQEFQRQSVNKTFQFGFNDVYSWDPENDDFLFVNLTGNHDVGYSGDATYQHMARYNQIFGKDNYWIEYNRGTDRAWRLVVLNDLLLEGPALQPEFVDYTWEFLYQLFERKFDGSTVLVTHVPFYKEEGLCVDGPEFRYYPDDYEREPYKANLLRSQNHISENVTNSVFNLIFSNDKPGIILTGHDHEGCEIDYTRNIKSGTWTATKSSVKHNGHNNDNYSIQEITVRSMMGEFNGNSGLLTGKFDKVKRQWQWTFTLCPFAIQHAWWIARVSILITGFLWSFYVLLD